MVPKGSCLQEEGKGVVFNRAFFKDRVSQWVDRVKTVVARSSGADRR